jgi:hypothetical protein
MGRLGRKRLSVDVPIKIHQQIKALSIRRNITITRWVLRAIYDKIVKEKKYDI